MQTTSWVTLPLLTISGSFGGVKHRIRRNSHYLPKQAQTACFSPFMHDSLTQIENILTFYTRIFASNEKYFSLPWTILYLK